MVGTVGRVHDDEEDVGHAKSALRDSLSSPSGLGLLVSLVAATAFIHEAWIRATPVEARTASHMEKTWRGAAEYFEGVTLHEAVIKVRAV